MMTWQVVLVWSMWSISITLSAEVSLPKLSVLYTGQNTALISWPEAYKDVEEQHIIEYGTDFDKHLKSLQIPKTTNKAMIHGLKHNTLYRARVKAPYSHPGPSVKFRTKRFVATAPDVAVQSSLHNKLLVSWRLPVGTHPSDVVHFIMVYGPLYSAYFMKTSLILPGNYRKFELKYLRADTVYKVKVAALLKTRKGPFSGWVVEKTANANGKITTHPSPSRTTVFEQRSTSSLNEPTTSSTVQNPTPSNEQTTGPITVGPTTHSGDSNQGGIKTTKRQQDATTTGTLNEASTSQSSFFKTTKSIPGVRNPTTVQLQKQTTERKKPAAPPKTDVTTPTLYSLNTQPVPTVSESLGKCERLLPSMCSDNGYDSTKVIFKQSQEEMIKHVETIWSKISPICKNKENLKRFICAVNFPYCSVRFGQPFLPCQSMCMIAKNSCSLDREDMWPAELDCNNFPISDFGALCVSFGHNDSASPTSPTTTEWDSTPPPSSPNTVRHSTELPSPSTMKWTSTKSPPLTTKQESSFSPSAPPSLSGLRAPSTGRCEPLNLSICASAGYGWTQLPNFFNQRHQNDAARSLNHFWPLVEANCSPFFTNFLCSLYVPVCNELLPKRREINTGNLLPCRSVCQKATQECGTIMSLYDYSWPKGVHCDMFPEDGKETCYYPNSDFVKYADPSLQPIQSTDIKQGVNGCQTLSNDHVCKKHYNLATLSSMVQSFQSADKVIRNRVSLNSKLANKKCLQNLELFMCSLYVPRCSADFKALGPCRSQCKTTVRRCTGLIKGFDTLLSELRNCRQFSLTECTANKRKTNKAKKISTNPKKNAK